MYRFDARDGRPAVTWRRTYPNIGVAKPGQTEAGSGTTPTLIGRRYVAITDNADPMHVLVYERQAAGGRAAAWSAASRCSRRAPAPPTSR